ncbi:MAG TPA: asparaginase, partial [Actinomycetota bacterium]
MHVPQPLVRLERSSLVESIHHGSVAVADDEGNLYASVGDPERVVFARSTTKPLQAAVSLGLIGEDLPDAEVAVMSASHNGEAIHLETVERILARAGLDSAALRCPPGLPLDPESARVVAEPLPVLHNCSGKHAGMLLACVRGGLDPASYLDAGHPLQGGVLEAVTAAAGRPPVAIGVDGCGVPVHALPLASLAALYARLPRAAPRPVAAMTAAPYLAAGRGRLCTAAMEAIRGLVVKNGAEGIMCAALIGRGLGVAVK